MDVFSYKSKAAQKKESAFDSRIEQKILSCMMGLFC